MKRFFALILTLCLFSGIMTPAHAENKTNTPEPVEDAAIASTLEELQAAIATAEEGEQIFIGATISISGERIECHKNITISRAAGFEGSLIELYGGTIAGLSFVETNDCLYTLDIRSAFDETIVQNCSFGYQGNGTARFIDISGGLTNDTNAVIDNCRFVGATDSAISAKRGTFVTVNSCRFDKNSSTMSGGAIRSKGNMKILNSAFSNGVAASGAGISGSGELTITLCEFENNSTFTPQFGRDVFSTGTLTITDEPEEDAGYYEETTGEKMILPLSNYEQTAKLVYLTTEQAKDYFAPASTPMPEATQTPEPTTSPETGGAVTPTQEPTALPSEPTATPTATPKPTIQPTQEPTQPPYYPPAIIPITKPTETPTVTPTPIPEATERPQEPIDDGKGEVTPTAAPKPTQQPTVPVTPTPMPTPESPKPILICGDAKIDTSHTIVLHGYGDGKLHESDPLTRAQLATIIYRLLDDESIAKYDGGQSAFKDVPSNAWYTRYVTTIGSAGIVSGVGGGKYSPNSNVTWAQIITVLTRFVEPQKYSLQHIPYSGWSDQAIQTAVALGWIEDSAGFQPNNVISRGELVELVNGVIARYR